MEDKDKNKEIFGTKMRVVVLAVKGKVSESVGADMVEELVSVLGMSKAPGSSLCKYPVDGKGGSGYTMFQPITESFIAFDSWPDLSGGYLVICSCGSLDITSVLNVVANYELCAKQYHNLDLGI